MLISSGFAGAIVTLSSGAPGSVQATSGADSTNNSALSSTLSAGLGMAFFATAVGIVAGLVVIS